MKRNGFFMEQEVIQKLCLSITQVYPKNYLNIHNIFSLRGLNKLVCALVLPLQRELVGVSFHFSLHITVFDGFPFIV